MEIMKTIRSQICILLAVLVSTFSSEVRLQASCPFCTALSGTISEEIVSSKVAAIGYCRSYLAPKSDKELHFGLFEMRTVLKGTEQLQGKFDWMVPSVDPMTAGDYYLVFAFNCEPMEFGGPVRLSEEAQKYLIGMVDLPESGVERLKYFLPFVESTDKVIADDAFNEFARASFAEVAQLKSVLDRPHVLDVLQSPKTSIALRRLYWTFLGLCGTRDDAKLFHELKLRSEKDPQFSLGLDAAIACYLSLAGESGLKEIESTYLQSTSASSNDLYMTLLALRVQGQEIQAISQKRLAQSLRLGLNRLDIADQILPDLARWEDWSILPELIPLFEKVDEEHAYLRVPIVRFAMACPLPEAQRALKRFEEIDPDAVRRARVLFPKAPSNTN
ncbi:MAG: hypothetical protein U0905_03630 [Pirellulales bacterium]